MVRDASTLDVCLYVPKDEEVWKIAEVPTWKYYCGVMPGGFKFVHLAGVWVSPMFIVIDPWQLNGRVASETLPELRKSLDLALKEGWAQGESEWAAYQRDTQERFIAWAELYPDGIWVVANTSDDRLPYEQKEKKIK